eukprot:1160495-Pelagomonas_calceolata.AAC.5
MPDISFRAEAAGFSAPDPLLFEFGFKLGEDDFQSSCHKRAVTVQKPCPKTLVVPQCASCVQQAASLERAASLQTQRGVNEYMVYVVAVNSVTGGRSTPETKVFNLTEFTPEGDTCEDQEASYDDAVQGKANEKANFNRLGATGDNKAIQGGMKATNGLGNADPPAFDACTDNNAGGNGNGNAGGDNGGGRRRLLEDHDFFQTKTLEGLNALLETLQVRA